jgi:general stress protein 26/nucleoside-triphosphatase THEP1
MEPRRTSPLKGLLDRILARVNGREPVRPILLVGGIGSGKTSTGLRLLSLLRQSEIQVGGFLAPRVMEGDETVGYSLIALATNATHPFASLEPNDVPAGRFFISEEGLALADRAVTAALDEASVVFVDEVGHLELGGGGHASAVRRLLASSVLPILLVRDELVEEVVRTFDIVDPVVFHARDALDASVASPAGLRTFWEIVDSLPYPLLVTLGEDGFPWSRPMHLVDREASTLWFATSRTSKKIAQVEADPHVTVLFVDSARFNYASIHGEAHTVADPQRERTLWHDDWRDDWPEGPADPDYVLLRVDGVRGHYLRGTTGEAGTVDLARSDAA